MELASAIRRVRQSDIGAGYEKDAWPGAEESNGCDAVRAVWARDGETEQERAMLSEDCVSSAILWWCERGVRRKRVGEGGMNGMRDEVTPGRGA